MALPDIVSSSFSLVSSFEGCFSQMRNPSFQKNTFPLYEVRRFHPKMQQPKLFIADTIDFVTSREALRSHLHLTRISRLSCLCWTSPDSHFLPLNLVPLGQMTRRVPRLTWLRPSSLTLVMWLEVTLTSDSSVDRLLNLELTFGNTGLGNTYSPWGDNDHFGQDLIRDGINVRSPERYKVSASTSVKHQDSGRSPRPYSKPNKRRSHLMSERTLSERASRLSGGPNLF